MSDSSLVWAAALGLSVAGSVGGLLVAGILLLFGPEVRNRVVPSLVSYAVGTLPKARLADALEAEPAGARLAVYQRLTVGELVRRVRAEREALDWEI